MSSTDGALQFLTSGAANAQNQQESESQTQLPSWYNDYTQNILNQVAQYGAAGYQNYNGPRIAGQDQLTQQAGQTAGALSGAAAQNYNQADSTIAGGAIPTYNTVQNYMNPYNKNVTDAIANAGNTNFQAHTMPAIESAIVGGGNITGSSTEGAQLAAGAAGQNQQAISQAQAAALQSGYNSSLNAAQQGAQNQIAAGTAESNAGAQGINNQLGALGIANQFGLQKQGQVQANENLAYQDFQNQNNFPLTAAAAEQSALAGINVPTTTVNYAAGQGTAMPVGNSPLVTGVGALGNYLASQKPQTTGS
jgi:hypothetical protein